MVKFYCVNYMELVLWPQNVIVCNSMVEQRNAEKIYACNPWNERGKNCCFEIHKHRHRAKHLVFTALYVKC